MKLFVYGTLQRGHGNNRLLRGADFVGEGVTKESFVLFNAGFPKAVPSEYAPGRKTLPVKGEVWEINEDHLMWCDRLEGHPTWYRREQQPVWVNGTFMTPFMYVMPSRQDNNTLCRIVDDMYYQWSG